MNERRRRCESEIVAIVGRNERVGVEGMEGRRDIKNFAGQ